MKLFRALIAGALAMLIGMLLVLSLLSSSQTLAASAPVATAQSQPSALNATTVVTMTFTPRKDTVIFEGVANSGGASTLLFAGFTSDTKERRALLAFDLSQVPTKTQIVSATLVLNVSRVNIAMVPSMFALHRLLGDWGEAGSSGGSGQGAPAKLGDATWEYAVYTSTIWNDSGGDFAVTASATTIVGGVGAYRWSGPQLLADVQSWFSAPAANFGWILLGVEDKAQTTKQIIARENANAASRPQLILTISGSISETQTSTLYLPLVQQ